jgi:hypothetical protein
MTIDSIGYLVPRTGFAGRVHSVFARACNIACGGVLLTVSAPEPGNGPTTLRLAPARALDLRDRFEVGEGVRCRDGRLRSRSTELVLLHARVWRPTRAGASLPRERIDERLRAAQRVLARRRSARPNVLDDAAAPVTAALVDACRALDCERATRELERLIGWGEGLTPAADDFLVGVVAALDVLACEDPRRQSFLAALTAAVRRNASRTTPVAAHVLRLAAGAHHPEALLRLRDALLADENGTSLAAALEGVLAIGASSGADTVSGLLAGLGAWLPADSTAARA